MVLLAACLVLAYTPAKTNANPADAISKIVHHGVFSVVASDGNTWDVEFTFNLSTQSFGYIDVTGYETGVPLTFSATMVGGSVSSVPSSGAGITAGSSGASFEFTKQTSMLCGFSIAASDTKYFDY